MYAIQFDPDGKHYQMVMRGNIEKLRDYLNFNKDIWEHLAVNKFAKFRLINLKDNKIIGELTR